MKKKKSPPEEVQDATATSVMPFKRVNARGEIAADILTKSRKISLVTLLAQTYTERDGRGLQKRKHYMQRREEVIEM